MRLINHNNLSLLEIGPRKRSEVQECFKNSHIETLDIVDDYNPTIIGDISKDPTSEIKKRPYMNIEAFHQFSVRYNAE